MKWKCKNCKYGFEFEFKTLSPESIDEDGFILCPQCGERAVNVEKLISNEFENESESPLFVFGQSGEAQGTPASSVSVAEEQKVPQRKSPIPNSPTSSEKVTKEQKIPQQTKVTQDISTAPAEIVEEKESPQQGNPTQNVPVPLVKAEFVSDNQTPDSGGICCPKCGSKDYSITTDVEGGGFSICKGCLGYLACGPCGSLLGMEKVKSKQIAVCHKCGAKWQF